MKYGFCVMCTKIQAEEVNEKTAEIYVFYTRKIKYKKNNAQTIPKEM